MGANHPQRQPSLAMLEVHVFKTLKLMNVCPFANEPNSHIPAWHTLHKLIIVHDRRPLGTKDAALAPFGRHT
jgi:hypothetical protein